MKRSLQRLVMLFCGLAATGGICAAENQSPIPQMNQLVNTGDYAQAYELGLANLADWEGDAAFDYLLGISALEAGFPNEAVFALERVAALPASTVARDRARVELARAYFLTNNLAAAENLFQAVLADNPPENVRENIQAFLQLIENRQDNQAALWEFAVSSVFGSDSNINSATSSSLIDTPVIGQIELDPDGQETDDQFSSSDFNLEYRRPLDRDRFFGVRAGLTHLDNIDTDQFDLDIMRTDLSYNWGGQVHRFRTALAVAQVELDGTTFQKNTGLSGSWQRSAGNGWYQSLLGSFSTLSYENSSSTPLNELRDVDQILVAAGLTRLTTNATQGLSLYYGDENSTAERRGNHNGRQYTGISYTLQYRVNAQNTPYLRLSAQDLTHDENHPVFRNDTRHDRNYSLSLGWTWQLTPGFSLMAEASSTRNDSNIEIFEYSRQRYYAGFRYQF